MKISGYRAKAGYVTEGYRQGVRREGAVWNVAKWGDQSVLVRRDMKFGNELALFRVQLGQE